MHRSLQSLVILHCTLVDLSMRVSTVQSGESRALLQFRRLTTLNHFPRPSPPIDTHRDNQRRTFFPRHPRPPRLLHDLRLNYLPPAHNVLRRFSLIIHLRSKRPRPELLMLRLPAHRASAHGRTPR